MAIWQGRAIVGGRRLLDRGTLDQARLSWRLLRDPRVSIVKYGIPAMLLIYLLSPLDAIPDFVLGIGQSDDLGVAVLAIMMFIRLVPMMAPMDVVDEHVQNLGLSRRRDQRGLTIERPVEVEFVVRR
jgi:uncharacterized membrane protein YkvA (DUF1232 family)